MRGYYEVFTVVSGAREGEVEIDFRTPGHNPDQALQDFVNDVAMAAALDGEPTEVYVLEHYHDPEDCENCSCVQYLTSMKPVITFNMGAEA